jgi:chromosome segregation ATPase
MFNMALLSALSALAAAAVAIVWLTKISKQISDLGMRVLESADIKKIIEAAEKTATYESRMAGCENRTEQSEDKLSKHEISLGELGAKLEATEKTANTNGTGLAEASEKAASAESRIVGCESKTEQNENRLTELGTKINEFADRLEAVERKLEEHAAGLAEANQGMKVMTDEIQSLEEFQAATEKTRNIIIEAFNDTQASIPPVVEECPETNVDTTEPQETLQESEEEQEQQVESTMGPWDNL